MFHKHVNVNYCFLAFSCNKNPVQRIFLCNITWFSYPKLNSIFTFSRFLLTVFRAVQIFLRKKIFSKHLRSNFRVNTRPKFNVHTTFIRLSSSHMNALDLFNLTLFLHWDEASSWPDACNERFQTCQYIT